MCAVYTYMYVGHGTKHMNKDIKYRVWI